MVELGGVEVTEMGNVQSFFAFFLLERGCISIAVKACHRGTWYG
jgi:hypothetical protein